MERERHRGLREERKEGTVPVALPVEPVDVAELVAEVEVETTAGQVKL